MFDRYTLAARRVILYARLGVTEIGGAEIDSDYLLWGLAKEAPELLDELGAEDLLHQITTDRAGGARAGANADLPLSRCATVALKRADEEARRLGSKEIRLAHLLLGLLADAESVAGRRLSRLGILAEQVRVLAREARIQALDNRPQRS